MEENKTPQRKMSKKKIIFSIIILIFLISGVYAYYSLFKISYIPAQLHVNSGSVKVNNEFINGNIKLKQGDIIETIDGLAAIILYESVVINLEKNTKISLQDLIKEHPKVKQEGGKTWNTFTKLSGVEDYTISEGNSVASVRATAFELSSGKIITGEGEVDYSVDNSFYIVEEKKVIEIISGEAVKRDATPEELAKIRIYMERAIQELKYLREKEIDEHPLLVNFVFRFLSGKLQEVKDGEVVSERELTKEELEKYLNDADEGKVDVGIILKEIPVKIASLEKIADITKKIQELNGRLAALN